MNNATDATPKARFIMIGGFLGAGKTTAIGNLAGRFAAQGLRVGLITNDQGRNLTDTALLRSRGHATEEIPGGCFCCRFNSLVDAVQKLARDARPDVFIAEPVGSCTDIVATVSYPLRQLYGDNYILSPVSVLLDPVRARRVFGLEDGPAFSPKVRYIYEKQVEEADMVVINKTDLISPALIEHLIASIQARFPRKEILAVSARNDANMDAWTARISGAEQAVRAAMSVDYGIYAEGEALLGWLNATCQLKAQRPFDAGLLLGDLALRIQQQIRQIGGETAHLKMTFSPEGNPAGEIAAINLVRNDFVPELSFSLKEPASAGQLIVNLRAEADPEALAAIVRQTLDALPKSVDGLSAVLTNIESFRPGKPNPTHRIANPLPAEQ